MSLKFPHAGLLVLAAAATAAAVGASSAQAAQTSTIDYRCKFPVIGTQPVQLQTSFDVPATWPVGEPTPPWEGTAKVLFPQALGGLAGLRTLGSVSDAQKPGKSSAIRTRVNQADASSFNVRVPLQLAPLTVTSPAPSEIALEGSATLPSLALDVEGQVAISHTGLSLNLYALGADGTPVPALRTPPIDVDGDPVFDSDGDPNTFDVPCAFGPVGNLFLALFELVDGTSPVPPTAPQPPLPSDYVESDFLCESINLKWRPATDDSAVKEYRIDYEGAPAGGVIVPAGANSGVFSKLITGLGADSEYLFSVTAIDFEGAEGESLEQTHWTLTPSDSGASGCVGPDTLPPLLAPLLTGTSTTTTVTLTWPAAADNVGVVGYDVFVGTATTPAVSTAGNVLTATVTGLNPATAYDFKVIAKDAAGNRSQPATATVPTKPLAPPPPVKYGYTLKGSTTLKTLTKGTLPLNGSIAAELTLATGAISADLMLADTSGRLVAAGFLPVTAKIGFVPSGKTTGSLVDGVLKTNSKVRIKVKEVKLFGAIPLAGGNTCQTKSLTDINLQSTQDEFSPLAGGPIAGTYKISDLNGCGALNGLVSPLTAGAGNTINLNLIPAA